MAIKRLILNPRPRIENGLIGVEKYPFRGMKYEKDSPTWANVAGPMPARNKMMISFFMSEKLMSMSSKE